MAEKSFKQIEAEIAEKGFAKMFEETIYDLQNFTRTVSYFLEQYGSEMTEEAAREIHTISGRAIWLGLSIHRYIEKYYKGE